MKNSLEKSFFSAKSSVATLEDALHILKAEFERRNLSIGSQQTYFSAIRKFVLTLNKEKDIQSLTIEDARNFINNQRYVYGMAPATCNGYSDGIRYLFVSVLHKTWNSSVFSYFEKEKRMPDVLSKDEIEQLIKVIDNPQYRMIAILIYSSGLRVSEVVRVRISDIHREKMLIFISQKKDIKNYSAILSNRCLKELDNYCREFRPTDYLFPSPQSGKRHITTHTVENNLRDASQNAGFAKHVTPNILRHSFVTHLVEANSEIFQAMKALGLSKLNSNQIYVHLAGLPGIISPYDT